MQVRTCFTIYRSHLGTCVTCECVCCPATTYSSCPVPSESSQHWKNCWSTTTWWAMLFVPFHPFGVFSKVVRACVLLGSSCCFLQGLMTEYSSAFFTDCQGFCLSNFFLSIWFTFTCSQITSDIINIRWCLLQMVNHVFTCFAGPDLHDGLAIGC